ncbi:MAG: helix-turn-helix transcriptional regulator [Burkholderiales bacterium]
MARARYEANKQFYIALGRRIAVARQPRMTQEELARAVSLSRTSIINIEKGRQQVLVHTLASISRALGVSPDKLLPPVDDLDVSLRGTPKSGRDWILNAVATTNKE